MKCHIIKRHMAFVYNKYKHKHIIYILGIQGMEKILTQLSLKKVYLLSLINNVELWIT